MKICLKRVVILLNSNVICKKLGRPTQIDTLVRDIVKNVEMYGYLSSAVFLSDSANARYPLTASVLTLVTLSPHRHDGCLEITNCPQYNFQGCPIYTIELIGKKTLQFTLCVNNL